MPAHDRGTRVHRRTRCDVQRQQLLMEGHDEEGAVGAASRPFVGERRDALRLVPRHRRGQKPKVARYNFIMKLDDPTTLHLPDWQSLKVMPQVERARCRAIIEDLRRALLSAAPSGAPAEALKAAVDGFGAASLASGAS